MALTCTEAYNSREVFNVVKNGKLEMQVEEIWFITGSDDPENSEVQATMPTPGTANPNISTVFLVNQRFSMYRQAVKEDGSDGVVKCILTYGDYDKLADSEDDEVDMDTESAHIENALSELSSFGTPSDVGLLIGINEGKVDGVDIQVPVGKFTYSGWIDSDVISEEETINAIQGLVGCQNDAAFQYWNTGEVLFLGARIAHSGSNNAMYKVRFNFSIRLQETNSVTFLGDGSPTSITKDGWDYLWFERYQQNDGTGKLKFGATAAHLVQIYYTGDFSTLETLIGDMV